MNNGLLSKTGVVESPDIAQIISHRGVYRNVLVSSASRKIPLIKTVSDAAHRLQSGVKVFAGDLDKHSLSQYVADGFVNLPKTNDANFETILEICKSNQIGIVIPTRDGELDFWAKCAAAFSESGIAVIVSDPSAITTSLDKLRFAKHGESTGLPIIPAWSELKGEGKFVVKERYGAGSRSIGLDLDADTAIAHAKTLREPIFQPFVGGVEVSADAWLSCDHQVKGLVLRTRDRVINGESAITTSFRNETLEIACRHVLESLPLKGPVILQLILDAAGLPHIIELNARFGGGSTASIAVGLDIWYWTLLEVYGFNLDDYPFHRISGEVRQVRIPSDLHFYDSHF